MAIYGYTFPTGRNLIQLKKIKNDCPSKELVAAVESVKYYRMTDGILNLFDKDVAVAVEMVYNSKYNSSASIFATTTSTPTTSTITTVKSNISGVWSIKSLFDIPFPSSPYKINITSTSIILQGGCNTYTYPYTLTPQVQVISLGAPTATKKACQNSDDQLYVSGVDKMYKYLESNTTSGRYLNFYDETGNIGYALEIRTGASTGASSNVGFGAALAQADMPFADGTVLMLLLKRRDLPRAVVTIKNNTLTYTRCNTISHTFKIADPKAKEGNISISEATSTRKACTDDNDSLYINALSSAIKYTYNAGSKTILFKDSNGTDVVTFNRS